MKRKHLFGWLGGLALIVALDGGCGGTSASNDTQADNAKANEKADPRATTSAVAADKPKVSSSAGTVSAPTASPWDAIGKHESAKDSAQPATAADNAPPTAADNAPLTAAPGKEFIKADVGIGEKGRGYGGGLITTEVKAYWTAKEHLTLLNLQHALDLYRANDPNGKGPKTQDEFMKKVVKENDIKLPELPEGHRYVYDPHTEELLVEQPKAP